MRAERHTSTNHPPVTNVVDDAGGVERRQWYIAIVNHNSEKQIAQKLDGLGVESYLPTQSEIRVWKNGRKSKVDRIVIPSTIFIHCSETERKEIVRLPFVGRFMTNHAGQQGSTGTKPLAIVPDCEISRLKFMLGQSDVPVEISARPYRPGDLVRVVRGRLAGLEGVVVDRSVSKSRLSVNLGILGCARLDIDTVNLELVGD